MLKPVYLYLDQSSTKFRSLYLDHLRSAQSFRWVVTSDLERSFRLAKGSAKF